MNARTRKTGTVPRIRVRRDQFNRRLREVYKGEPQYKIADHFGEDPSSFSLILCGRRAPSAAFVADTIHLLGGAFEDYFIAVEREQALAA